jgi:hypothetical protein
MPHALRSSAIRVSVLMAAALAAGAAGGSRPAAPPQAVPPDPGRQGHMQVHFGEAMAVHEAVIRGDLAAARAPAAWLATHDAPASLPSGSAPFVAAMREAARQTAAASTVQEAAMGAAAMLKTCGDCHRGLGTVPPPPLAAPPPEVHGVVGHMLGHQRAADQMLQGLVTPSSALWREGAQGLATPALDHDALPRDARSDKAAKDAERRIHTLAAEAGRVEDQAARAVFYAQILARCATCHSGHSKVWGPARR